jgi:hypothetical protein
MDNHRFDTAINEAMESVKKRIETCETYMIEFMDPTFKLCEEKIEVLVEDRIIKEPQITKKLGHEGLNELLHKKEGLMAELPNIIQKELGSDKIWKHRIILDKPEYEDISDYFIDIYDFKIDIKKSLGKILGYGVELLLEYNYFKKHDRDDWGKSDNDKIVYTREIEFSHEMDTIVVNYLDSYHLLYESFVVLEALKLEKDEDEAMELLKKVKDSIK